MEILTRTCIAFENGLGRIFSGGVKSGWSFLKISVATVLTAFVPACAKASDTPLSTVVGAVTLTAGDGSMWAGDGARVALVCGDDRTTRTEVADHRGAFRFLGAPVGSCSIEAEVQGFAAQPIAIVTAAGQAVEIHLRLGVVPVRVSVNVVGSGRFHEPKVPPKAVDLTQVQGGRKERGKH